MEGLTRIQPETARREQAETLASMVYNRLRTDIVHGILRPGEKLRVEHLRHRYGTGTSPLREALNRLSSDGFVAREDQKGFRVASISKSGLRELVHVRCLIETAAIKESIQHGDVAWEEQIVLALHRLTRLHHSTTTNEYTRNPEWEERHRTFHLALISGCGSELLIGFCQQLHDRADWHRQIAIRAVYPDRNVREEHEEIAKAILSRDAVRASKLLVDHYKRTEEIIIDAVGVETDDDRP